MTGNLEVITNLKLRSLLAKGPSYREANKIDWVKVLVAIKKGITDCQVKWCAREKVDTSYLDEWKCRLFHVVKIKINSLKARHRKTFKVLDDKKVKNFLKSFHEKFVITPTDKAGNNFSIVCKKYYIICLLKELNILKDSEEKKKTESTYVRLKTKPEDIVKRRVKYMEKHNIDLDESQLKLPFLYWIPKMHKIPSKQRYIAASHSCSTKPLSKMITFCLKLIQQTHQNHCKAIARNNGVNRMWIVENSVEVMNKITGIKKGLAKNIRTYDFSTLYTSIPHSKLKQQLAWVIKEAFNDKSRQFIRIGRGSARWSSSRGKANDLCWDKDELIGHIKWLIDNIYVVCGDSMFRQVIGIPMGTDCAPFLANLFLFAYEYKWLKERFDKKEFDVLKKFQLCFRYIDDLLCINNDQLMDDVMTNIYPKELSLTSDDAVLQSHYLDLDLEIRNGNIHSKLFDKRDAFGFSIINFPDLSGNIPAKQSYGVFVSQLIRYGRCCMHAVDFIARTKILVHKLQNQGFKPQQLKRVFEKFAKCNYELLFKYDQSISDICTSCC